MAQTPNLLLPYAGVNDAPNGAQQLADLASALDSLIGGAWTPYSPVWSSSGTQPVLNNGSLPGNYKIIGKVAHVRITLTFGSTTTVGTGVYRFSLPSAAAPKVNSLLPALFMDSSDGSRLYPCTVRIVLASTTGDNMRIAIAGNVNSFGAAAPVVPAVGDVLMIDGSYEIN